MKTNPLVIFGAVAAFLVAFVLCATAHVSEPQFEPCVMPRKCVNAPAPIMGPCPRGFVCLR